MRKAKKEGKKKAKKKTPKNWLWDNFKSPSTSKAFFLPIKQFCLVVGSEPPTRDAAPQPLDLLYNPREFLPLSSDPSSLKVWTLSSHLVFSAYIVPPFFHFLWSLKYELHIPYLCFSSPPSSSCCMQPTIIRGAYFPSVAYLKNGCRSKFPRCFGTSSRSCRWSYRDAIPWHVFRSRRLVCSQSPSKNKSPLSFCILWLEKEAVHSRLICFTNVNMKLSRSFSGRLSQAALEL